jgi:pimeloyl-ACP methyl ester carboxylesterase
VLLVAFEPDVILPPRSARAMAAIVPGAELVLIDDAGHGEVHTHAAETAKHVIEFLTRHR